MAAQHCGQKHIYRRYDAGRRGAYEWPLVDRRICADCRHRACGGMVRAERLAWTGRRWRASGMSGWPVAYAAAAARGRPERLAAGGAEMARTAGWISGRHFMFYLRTCRLYGWRAAFYDFRAV